MLKHIDFGSEPMRARAQAIDGLGYSAPWQEKRLQKLAVEALGSLQ